MIVGLGGVVLSLTALFSYQSHLPPEALIDYLPIVVTFLAYAYRDHLSYRVQVERSLQLFSQDRIEVENRDCCEGELSGKTARRLTNFVKSGTFLRPILALSLTLGLLIEVGLATTTPTSKSLIFTTPVSKTVPIVRTHHSCSGRKSMQL